MQAAVEKEELVKNEEQFTINLNVNLKCSLSQLGRIIEMLSTEARNAVKPPNGDAHKLTVHEVMHPEQPNQSGQPKPLPAISLPEKDEWLVKPDDPIREAGPDTASKEDPRLVIARKKEEELKMLNSLEEVSAENLMLRYNWYVSGPYEIGKQNARRVCLFIGSPISNHSRRIFGTVGRLKDVLAFARERGFYREPSPTAKDGAVDLDNPKYHPAKSVPVETKIPAAKSAAGSNPEPRFNVDLAAYDAVMKTVDSCAGRSQIVLRCEDCEEGKNMTPLGVLNNNRYKLDEAKRKVGRHFVDTSHHRFYTSLQ